MDYFQLKLAAVARPGDTLIFEVVEPSTLTKDGADEIRARLSERLPDVKAVFLTGGLTVGGVVRSEDLAPGGWISRNEARAHEGLPPIEKES